MSPFSPHTALIASPDQVSSELDGEIVVLNHRDGVYFGLDAGVGALVWRRLQTPATPAELVSLVMDAFEVDEERCSRDVGALLEQLQRAGLVQAAPDA